MVLISLKTDPLNNCVRSCDVSAQSSFHAHKCKPEAEVGTVGDVSPTVHVSH